MSAQELREQARELLEDTVGVTRGSFSDHLETFYEIDATDALSAIEAALTRTPPASVPDAEAIARVIRVCCQNRVQPPLFDAPPDYADLAADKILALFSTPPHPQPPPQGRRIMVEVTQKAFDLPELSPEMLRASAIGWIDNNFGLLSGMPNATERLIACFAAGLGMSWDNAIEAFNEEIANRFAQSPTPDASGDTDVERVARAIHPARWKEGASNPGFYPFEDELPDSREYCNRLARAAIAALQRSPTIEQAVAEERDRCARVAANFAHLTYQDYTIAGEAERAMHRAGYTIAAAIRQGPTTGGEHE